MKFIYVNIDITFLWIFFFDKVNMSDKIINKSFFENHVTFRVLSAEQVAREARRQEATRRIMAGQLTEHQINKVTTDIRYFY